MIESAQVHPGMTVDAARLDAELDALNTPSGVVDLRTGCLAPHSPGRWMTKITAYPYQPEATCPRFLAFLARFTSGDSDLAEYIQRLIGLAASGNRGERLLPLLNGPGGNGKTTFAKAVKRALGDYAIVGDAQVILAGRRDGGPSEEVAMLHGARLVILPDLPSGTLNAGRVKRLTGGDPITANRKYGHSFEFDPTHTFLLDANVPPRIAEHSQAVWDRVRLIPCKHRFVGPNSLSAAEVDAIFAQEGPGILAWIVQGAVKYHSDGLGIEPDGVLVATRDYRDTEDLVGQFLTDRCDFDETAWTASISLYTAYKAWCDAEGHEPLTLKAFGLQLAAHALERGKQRGVRGWHGIRVGADQ